MADVVREVGVYGGWSTVAAEGVYIQGIFFDETPNKWSAEAADYLNLITTEVKKDTGIRGNRLVSSSRRLTRRCSFNLDRSCTIPERYLIPISLMRNPTSPSSSKQATLPINPNGHKHNSTHITTAVHLLRASSTPLRSKKSRIWSTNFGFGRNTCSLRISKTSIMNPLERAGRRLSTLLRPIRHLLEERGCRAKVISSHRS